MSLLKLPPLQKPYSKMCTLPDTWPVASGAKTTSIVHVGPADHNWVRNVAVARLLVHALRRLDPKLPPRPPGIADAALE